MADKPPPKDDIVWVTEFRHWRSGQILKASDYGLRAWPIPRRKK